MKASLFTVSFAGLWGQHTLSLEEAIDKTAELGYEGVEIMGKRPHLSPLEVSLDDCYRLRDRLDERNIACSAVAAYTNFTGGMDAAEVPLADMQIAYVEELARRAEALNCPLVRIFSSYERDDVPFIAQWRRTIAAIQECCDRAAEYNVTIGLQNHHDMGVDTSMLAEMLYQIDRPNLIPMVDCWSLHLRGEDIEQALAEMAPRMEFTTVADYRVLKRAAYRPGLTNYTPSDPPVAFAAPMGKGELPYRLFFDALTDAGFDGWVSYEMCSPLRDGGALDILERYARTFLDYMKPWL
ncbi:MAG: sugar phosphate isomerase/epimerase [Planctomycetes bacterium]|nr:sugar phosphate isomerase/epimerase [Planctomycetota bacterium]